MSATCIVRPAFLPPYARKAKNSASVATAAMEPPTRKTIVSAR